MMIEETSIDIDKIYLEDVKKSTDDFNNFFRNLQKDLSSTENIDDHIVTADSLDTITKAFKKMENAFRQQLQQKLAEYDVHQEELSKIIKHYKGYDFDKDLRPQVELVLKDRFVSDLRHLYTEELRTKMELAVRLDFFRMVLNEFTKRLKEKLSDASGQEVTVADLVAVFSEQMEKRLIEERVLDDRWANVKELLNLQQEYALLLDGSRKEGSEKTKHVEEKIASIAGADLQKFYDMPFYYYTLDYLVNQQMSEITSYMHEIEEQQELQS